MAMSRKEWLDIFSGNLKDMMREGDYSVGELSFATGIPQSTISRYVNGERIPTPYNIVRLARELNVPVNDLIDFYEPIE